MPRFFSSFLFQPPVLSVVSPSERLTQPLSKDLHIQLIDRSQAGDLRAQHRLFNLYVKAMYNTVVRIVPNTMEAEDVVQEAFVKAFRNLHRFQRQSSFGHWLKRIMINTALNAVKRHQRDPLSLSADIEEQSDELMDIEPDGLPPPEVVHDAIKALPEGCRIIFTLYQLEGYDQKEIAAALEVSVSTVKTQYRRARLLLIEQLKNYTHEGQL